MSKKHLKKKSSLRTGEVSTKQRRTQNGGVISEVVDRDISGKALIIRHKARYTCTLDRYFGQLRLSEAEYKAGIRFQHAYLRAVLRVKVYDVGGGSQGDAEMAALIVIKSEKLLKEAYSVLSEKQKAIIIAICGHDEFAGDTYRMQTLRRGLTKLSELWKL